MFKTLLLLFISCACLDVVCAASVSPTIHSLESVHRAKLQTALSMGFDGRILNDDDFNLEQRPVTMPALVIEDLPKSSSKIGLALPRNLELMNQLLIEGYLLLISTADCNQTAMAMAKHHPSLLRWNKVLKRNFEGAIVFNQCASDTVVFHEYYHLLQYRKFDSYQALAYKIYAIAQVEKVDFFWTPQGIVQKLIEAQASIYSLKRLHRGRFKSQLNLPEGVPMVLLPTHQQLFYLETQYKDLWVGVNKLSQGDSLKQERLMDILKENLPIEGDNFYSSLYGWYRFFCKNKESWELDSRFEESNSSLRTCPSSP